MQHEEIATVSETAALQEYRPVQYREAVSLPGNDRRYCTACYTVHRRAGETVSSSPGKHPAISPQPLASAVATHGHTATFAPRGQGNSTMTTDLCTRLPRRSLGIVRPGRPWLKVPPKVQYEGSRFMACLEPGEKDAVRYRRRCLFY